MSTPTAGVLAEVPEAGPGAAEGESTAATNEEAMATPIMATAKSLEASIVNED